MTTEQIAAGEAAARMLAAVLPAYAFANSKAGEDLPGHIRVHLLDEVSELTAIIHAMQTLIANSIA